MNISKKTENNYLVITLSGRLDSHTSPELAKSLEEHVEIDEKGIIFDMIDLDYISSAGLRLILNTSKFLKGKNKSFVLCQMQDHILEIFEISGFDTFLNICPSVNEALNK
jgi:anti-sigma B factor antagonist